MTMYPTSVRLTQAQRTFLGRLARQEQHGKIATVIRQLIEQARQSQALAIRERRR